MKELLKIPKNQRWRTLSYQSQTSIMELIISMVEIKIRRGFSLFLLMQNKMAAPEANMSGAIVRENAFTSRFEFSPINGNCSDDKEYS